MKPSHSIPLMQRSVNSTKSTAVSQQPSLSLKSHICSFQVKCTYSCVRIHVSTLLCVLPEMGVSLSCSGVSKMLPGDKTIKPFFLEVER